ncbi:hypothetical protein PPACK8108_LOCUS20182 [Phakopsora pachyrhizi]|uniref:Uncharacterized protein n=1 Tax=Phakopsora pachyrhizi TaxID=170000 RepID=A0AAV0BH32_PHAPC|nr:hypothetical protein PPACK8108_LOCUS20182 [Phakopsora pachyrhizi]
MPLLEFSSSAEALNTQDGPRVVFIQDGDGEKLLKNVAQELSSSLDLAYVYFTYGPTLHLPIGHDQVHFWESSIRLERFSSDSKGFVCY